MEERERERPLTKYEAEDGEKRRLFIDWKRELIEEEEEEIDRHIYDGEPLLFTGPS